MRKRLLSFSMTIMLVLALLGCESIQPYKAGNIDNSNANPDTTITIAARDGSHSDVIMAVKDSFEQQHNCHINIVSLSANDLHDNIIKSSSDTIATYDVIMIDDPLMPEYIEKKVLTNLTQLGYIDDEDFVEKSRLLGKDPFPLGATYALPFSGNVQLIFYNSDLLGSNADLSNWNSILSNCQELKAKGNNGYAIRGQSGNPIVSDFLPILWAFGGDIFDSGNNVILNSQESRNALNFYLELLKTGDNYEKDDLIDAVTNGNAAIALGWPSWFISGNGSSAEIAQIPGKKDASSEPLATGEIGNWLLGVTSNSGNKELALELVTYLTSSDVQTESLQYGGIPTRTSIFKNKEVIEQYPYFETIYSGTNNSRVRPRTTKWSQIEEVFGEELVKCIEGKESVDDCIINSEAAIKALATK